MLIWIVSILFLAAMSCFWFCRQLFPAIIRKKAQASLDRLIFPQGEAQKQAMMETFHGFTKERFSDDQIMDYFMKIKGLQNLSISSKTEFWIKKYLKSPTKIKLNYFEQVKFYELFMNFPPQMEIKAPLGEVKTLAADKQREPNFTNPLYRQELA
jgi:hypothetical protein